MPSRRGDGPVSTANATQLGMLGLRVDGDIGPWTVYTDRYGRKKWFLYSPPTKPATTAQLNWRDRFRNAQASWSALTPDEKAALELAVNKASLCLTGQNLWISAILKSRQQSYLAVERQTGITLPSLPSP